MSAYSFDMEYSEVSDWAAERLEMVADDWADCAEVFAPAEPEENGMTMYALK